MPNDPTSSIYNALPLGVAVVDASLRVKRWNALLERWSGVSAERAVGETLVDLFPQFRRNRFEQRLDSVFRHGQSVVLSTSLHQQFLPLRTPAGDPIAHRTHGSPAPDDPGCALLVLEDVTPTLTQLVSLRAERRSLRASERSLRKQQQELEAKNAAIAEARRQAEDANRAKSAFLANMSHEIRTPLTAINGFANVAVEHLEPGEIARDATQRVLRNSEHLLGLLNDVLDLSKVEAGRLTLKPIACSPGQIAEEVLDTLSSRAESKGIALRVRAAGDTPSTIHADPVRVRQVLLNLVGNAIKFTSQGEIELAVAADDANNEPEICFRVRDTGIGIAADKLEVIFEPFAQADESMQRAAGGTGLGLSLSRNLVEQMGGRLSVSSELGVGSVFSVSIPCGRPGTDHAAPSHRPHASDAVSDGVSESEPTPMPGVRVLVAEDGPDNQVLIRYLLERAGAAVAIVGNGSAAVEAYTHSPVDYDLVLMDMQMPIMDGYTAAAELRRRGCDTPIVALTAHAMNGDQQQALDAGCDAYVAKPINAPQLIERLAALIRQSRVEDAPAFHEVTA